MEAGKRRALHCAVYTTRRLSINRGSGNGERPRATEAKRGTSVACSDSEIDGASGLPQPLERHVAEAVRRPGLPVRAGELPVLEAVVGGRLARAPEPDGPVLEAALLALDPALALRLLELQLRRLGAGHVALLEEALVRPEAAVRRRQHVDEARLEVVQLDGEAGEAVVELVVLRQRARAPDAAGGRRLAAVQRLVPLACP